jgi:hypothetical protein
LQCNYICVLGELKIHICFDLSKKKSGRDAAKIDFELISGYRCHSDNTVFSKHTHKTPKTQKHEQYRIELVFLGAIIAKSYRKRVKAVVRAKTNFTQLEEVSPATS